MWERREWDREGEGEGEEGGEEDIGGGGGKGETGTGVFCDLKRLSRESLLYSINSAKNTLYAP